jgi:O-antigen ligase
VQPALLMALVATSYLLLAGAASWSQPPIWGLTMLAAAAAPRRTFSFPRGDRALDLALGALVIAMVIQIVPLPAMVIDLVSPHARELRSATRLGMGGAAGWLPLSVDVTATLQAVATVMMTVLAFWIARGVFSAGGFTRQYCRILGWLGATAAVVAIAQKAVRPGLLLGMVAPSARNGTPFGPFLNRNHFAAWLLMVAAVSIGYLIAHLQIHPAYRLRFWMAAKHFMTSGAMLSGLCSLVIVVVMLATLSRSAAAGLGAAAVIGGWLGRSRLRIERTSLPAMLSAAGIALLAISATIDIQGWNTRLQESFNTADQFDRLTIWRESAGIVGDFPVAGTGAGTYGQAMSEYQQSRVWVGAMHSWAFFNNAHSHYVQVLAEGGLLLALPLAAAIAMIVRLGLAALRGDKGEMFWIRIGAAAGMAGIAVQSIWEVALVIPANAVVFATLAGLLLYRREPGRPAGGKVRSA